MTYGDTWATNELWISDKTSQINNLPFNELTYTGPLNESQKHAVQDMLNPDKDISIIQGPPGTGKTTVIAAYITEALLQPDKICLIISQSNVAIKNVAEKLYYSGISDWKLIVSSEFLTGWYVNLLYTMLIKLNNIN